MGNIILESSYGNYNTYKSSLENAVKIFEEVSENFQITKFEK